MTALWNELRALMPEPQPKRFPADTVALFPPRDNAAKALQILIGAASVSVNVSMFTYTDKLLDGLLHQKAADPAITLFQMVLDEGQTRQDSSQAKLLAGWSADMGKRVAVGKSEHGQIIHRKIVVVNHLYVAGGSTNWTTVGEDLEDNELVIRRCAPLAAWYEQVLDANFARVIAVTAAKAASAAAVAA